MVDERNEEVVFVEKTNLDNKKKNKFLPAGIISIIFSVIATAGFIYCVILFAEFLGTLNVEVPVGRAFVLVFYIIFGLIGAIVALIGLITSIFAIKWKKVPGIILLSLNSVYILLEIVFFVIMMITNNAVN